MKCDKCDNEAVRTSMDSHLCAEHFYPQPMASSLDRNALRDFIIDTLVERERQVRGTRISVNYSLAEDADSILALIPDVDEARRQGYDEGVRDRDELLLTPEDDTQGRFDGELEGGDDEE